MVQCGRDEKIAEAYSCRTWTIEKLRHRLVKQGFYETLNAGSSHREADQWRAGGEGDCDAIGSTAEVVY